MVGTNPFMLDTCDFVLDSGTYFTYPNGDLTCPVVSKMVFSHFVRPCGCYAFSHCLVTPYHMISATYQYSDLDKMLLFYKNQLLLLVDYSIALQV